jgi:hypothetical protein
LSSVHANNYLVFAWVIDNVYNLSDMCFVESKEIKLCFEFSLLECVL